MSNYERLMEIGRASYAGIAGMMTAHELDYDDLAYLREARDDGLLSDHEAAELAELEADAEGLECAEDALRRIHESALEVLFRSDWTVPGQRLVPAEYLILLTTGGPAVRIIGELDAAGCSPDRATLEVQDSGMPWTECPLPAGGHEVLLRFARLLVDAPPQEGDA